MSMFALAVRLDFATIRAQRRRDAIHDDPSKFLDSLIFGCTTDVNKVLFRPDPLAHCIPLRLAAALLRENDHNACHDQTEQSD